MRKLPYFISLTLVSSALWAGDGRTPRSSAADYPVHQEIAPATIAAVRVTPEQLNKTFPPDLAKKYVVLEVAIYPKEGPAMEVKNLDFVLRLGDSESRPETGEEVAWMWVPHRGPGPDLKTNTHVTTETGVYMGTGQIDPNTGRRVNNTGTYESIGVSNAPQAGPAPSSTSSRVDADRMEELLKKWALPDGKTNSPVAGYVYFRLPTKKTKGAWELQYERDGATASLPIATSTK